MNINEHDAGSIHGADLVDVMAKDLRVVTLCFHHGRDEEYIVHREQMQTLIDASIKLHFDPGINPHSLVEAAKIYAIKVARLRAYGQYWWTKQNLGTDKTEDGAFTISAGVGRIVWRDDGFSAAA